MRNDEQRKRPTGDRSAPHEVLPFRTRLAAVPNLLRLPLAFDVSNTILLAGSSRSGTTWLSQVMSSSRRTCLLTEPFHPKMPGLTRAGFTWRTYRSPDDAWPTGEEKLRRTFQGKGVTLKLLLRNGWNPFGCDTLLVKAVRVNRLLPWIDRRFDLRGVILLIRHPCAVVSSQMAHFKHVDLSREDDLRYVEHHYPDLLGFARELATEEERRALTWALDQHAPLARPGRWAVASYEKLVSDGGSELERLFKGVGLPTPPGGADLLSENSWQTRAGSVDHARASVEERLNVWRQRLDSDQVRRILNVVETFGIEGFGPEGMPRVDRIGIRSPAT